MEKKIPNNYLTEAIKYYEENEKFETAARIAEEVGMNERAIELYCEMEDYGWPYSFAIEVAKKSRDE